MRKYGNMPIDFGHFVNPNPEMMFWMYCPISLPGMTGVCIPETLSDYKFMVDIALANEDWHGKYVYITAKTLHVTPDNMGNRKGWHSDGFGTNDINYIWGDECPTEFLDANGLFALSSDHLKSMEEMQEVSDRAASEVWTYEKGHILRLDPSVIHRVADQGYTGFRSFAKVTISDNKFDLAGNSVNHALAPGWVYTPRTESRNLESSAA
jgi:hypothetical protein